MIAIGLGCRRGINKKVVIDLVREALGCITIGDETIAFFSVDDKRDEAGLIAAAADLRWPLLLLPRAALEEVESAIVTPSHYAEAALGLASVSEAAALAGAGRGARLLVPRISKDGVTCAIARGEGR